MRLVKISDVIVNMDKVVMIKGKSTSSDTINVYIYTTDNQQIYLGECQNKSSYGEFVQELYEGLLSQFPDDVVSIYNNSCDDELWS